MSIAGVVLESARFFARLAEKIRSSQVKRVNNFQNEKKKLVAKRKGRTDKFSLELSSKKQPRRSIVMPIGLIARTQYN